MEMNKKVKWLSYFLIPGLAIIVSCKDDDDDNGNNNGNNDDGRNEVVMEQISYSNNAEVDLGQLASTQGTDSLVKAFGEMMVNDHENAQEDLDSLADERNIDLPTTLKDEHADLKDSLDNLSGLSFDSAYIQSQVVMHTEAKNLFEAIADTTDDQDLKNYVNNNLPRINMHLMEADSILDLLTGGGNDTTGVGNDTTGVGNDTTGVGNDTTDVGNDTTGVGNDTTGVGNDTTGVGNDTIGSGDDTSGTKAASAELYIRRR